MWWTNVVDGELALVLQKVRRGGGVSRFQETGSLATLISACKVRH